MNRAEGIVFRGDGTSFPSALTTPTFARYVGHPSVTAIFKDISDSKRVDELHRRAERLEAVAAVGIAGARDQEPAGLDPELGRAAGAGRRVPGRTSACSATLVVREPTG